MDFKTTKDIKISDKIVDQIIGQEAAVEIIKKASKQRRHVFLIGDPGTGKSMIGLALAELLPKEKLVDILSIPNSADDNVPLIKTVPRGQGKELVWKLNMQAMSSFKNQTWLMFGLVILVSLLPYYFWKTGQISDVIYAASMITGIVFIIGFMLFMNLGRRASLLGGEKKQIQVPKLIIDNSGKDKAPFIDGTGSHDGALLGDVLHDPLQSGGLGTPAYQRLIPGMIHRANGGVLFIDEVSTLSPRSQQEILTVLQEKKYPITGQSERSSGSMVRSEPVPADFVLVAAGNVETVTHMHPALRSRIRGYGYEVYMNTTMDDTKENRDKIAVFVAQEVFKDAKIPPFSKAAVEVIIGEAKKRAGMADKLTLRLRELGGLVRAAGDLAKEKGATIVEPEHIKDAMKIARTLEEQIADKYIDDKKKYEVIIIKGEHVGRVNGLAVIGSGGNFSGIVMPIESEVTLGGKKTEFIATGKLGQIAQEAVKNVSAIILKYFGEDIKEKYDIFIQFLQTYEGVEGDSASIAVATAIISALKGVPVRQDLAMTGSLSVRGDVLAVGGVTSKVEAAIEAGIPEVIIPKANERDVILSSSERKKVKIIPVSTIQEVLKEALVWKGKEDILRKILKKSK